MSYIPRIFNQYKPFGGEDYQLFVVESGTQAQLSIFVCNQAGSNERFRIAVVPNQENLTTARYLAWDTILIGNGVFALSGIGLNSGDSIWVRNLYGNASFTATGMQFG